MRVAQAAGGVFFPLDEELALLPGALSPRLQEMLVRLSTWLPSFAQAAEAMGWCVGVRVSEAATRRHTEAAGAAAVALHDAEVDRLEAERPAPPMGPLVQQVSADGTMVPLLGGQWSEVKTLAVGTVVATHGADGTPHVQTEDVSYFARLADSATFTRDALAELHRRGTEAAGTVVAIQDGSEWLQGFIDLHRPDAVRILDFPHAVEHLNRAAQACLGEGTPGAVAWLDQHAAELKVGDPDVVLAALRALPTERAPDSAIATAERDGAVAYFEKRRDQLDYARFQRLGFPIGSGAVESGHKNVVASRLKGPGKHWALHHVDAMLALRCTVANDRWDETWPRIARSLRSPIRAGLCQRRRPRVLSAHQANRPLPRRQPPRPRVAPHPRLEPTIIAGHPTNAHPWKKAAQRTAARKLTRSLNSTKL